MASRLWTVAVDAHDPASLSRFWADVLDWTIFYESADEVVISKDDKTWPGMGFVPVPESKTVKTRLHIDLAPDDQDAEVVRIVGPGGKVVEIGQATSVGQC